MKITIETDDMKEAGDNVLAIVQDGKLILVIDTTEEIGPSSSGKMMGIASTSGFTTFPGGLQGQHLCWQETVK